MRPAHPRDPRGSLFRIPSGIRDNEWSRELLQDLLQTQFSHSCLEASIVSSFSKPDKPIS